MLIWIATKQNDCCHFPRFSNVIEKELIARAAEMPAGRRKEWNLIKSWELVEGLSVTKPIEITSNGSQSISRWRERLWNSKFRIKSLFLDTDYLPYFFVYSLQFHSILIHTDTLREEPNRLLPKNRPAACLQRCKTLTPKSVLDIALNHLIERSKPKSLKECGVPIHYHCSQ